MASAINDESLVGESYRIFFVFHYAYFSIVETTKHGAVFPLLKPQAGLIVFKQLR